MEFFHGASKLLDGGRLVCRHPFDRPQTYLIRLAHVQSDLLVEQVLVPLARHAQKYLVTVMLVQLVNQLLSQCLLVGRCCLRNRRLCVERAVTALIHSIVIVKPDASLTLILFLVIIGAFYMGHVVILNDVLLESDGLDILSSQRHLIAVFRIWLRARASLTDLQRDVCNLKSGARRFGRKINAMFRSIIA